MPISAGHRGYTLVEMVVVIIIIGVIAAIAGQWLAHVYQRMRTEETLSEMERLAQAIAGISDLTSGAIRTDHGYVGDIGSLPGSWDDLVINPGYASWHGPYVYDRFTGSGINDNFKLDAWNKPYSAPGITFMSCGGPDTLTVQIANGIEDLLYNRVIIVVTDADRVPPGQAFVDSLVIRLVYPDGTGGLTRTDKNPAPDGLVVFEPVPIGIHLLQVISSNVGDTLVRKINVNAGEDYYEELVHFADLW